MKGPSLLLQYMLFLSGADYFYLQSMLKYSRKPHIQEPDILDIKQKLRKSAIDVKQYNDVRHFRFKPHGKDPMMVEMSWKKSCLNDEWEGSVMYFAPSEDGSSAEVDVSDLVEVTKTSGRILVCFCLSCN